MIFIHRKGKNNLSGHHHWFQVELLAKDIRSLSIDRQQLFRFPSQRTSEGKKEKVKAGFWKLQAKKEKKKRIMLRPDPSWD